jgi:hypothetical protein
MFSLIKEYHLRHISPPYVFGFLTFLPTYVFSSNIFCYVTHANFLILEYHYYSLSLIYYPSFLFYLAPL